MIHVNIYRNPLDQARREQMCADAGDTLRSLTKRILNGCSEWPFPTIAIVDGEPWKRGRWLEPLSDGMVVEFRSMVRNGGGGPAVAGSIGAILTTGMSTGLIPLGMGLQALGGMGAMAGIPGSNALMNLGGKFQQYGSMGRLGGLPELPESPSSVAGESGSPTYSIGGKGNRKRIGEPVPVIYGTMRVFPDLISEAYTEFVTQDIASGVKATGSILLNTNGNADLIYLDEVYFLISDGTTSITFEFNSSGGITGGRTEVSVDTGSIESTTANLYNAINAAAFNVTATGYDASAGIVYLQNDNYGSTGNVNIIDYNSGGYLSVSGMSGGETSPQTSEMYLNLPLCIGVGEYSIDQSTIRMGESVESFFRTVQICTPGSPMNIIYPWVINHQDTTGVKLTTSSATTASSYSPVADETVIGVIADFVCPGGLWNTSGTSFTNNTITVTLNAEKVSEAFVVNIGNTGAISTTMNSRDNAKFSIKYIFASPVSINGFQLHLYATRSSGESTTTDKADSCQMVSCRRILSSSQSFDDVTTMAVRIKASDKINGEVADKLSIVVNRLVPIWDGNEWSTPTSTRSIAWALADILRNEVYGMGISDSLIDLDALLALDAIWTARGDYFDGVFDQTLTAWEALQRVARCGRAIPVLNNGVITFVRDGEKTVRAGLFNQSNILPGSLSIQYAFREDSEPDGVDLTYIDTATWQQAHVVVAVPGGPATPVNPQTVDLFGCTDVDQATREATYLARRIAYMRKTITWQTEMDGRLLSLGDMVALSHDVPAWSQSGEVIGFTDNGATCDYLSSQPLDWSAAGTKYVLIKKQDGSVSGPHTATEITGGFRINDPAWVPNSTLENGERSTFIFYVGTVQDVVITDISPSGDTTVTITAVPYDARIHAAGA